MKKFSLASAFTRLTLIVAGAILLVTILGRLVTLQNIESACAQWPLCAPENSAGWLALTHQLSAIGAGLLMTAFFFSAWKNYRHDIRILPLVTVISVAYFGEALIGSVQLARGFQLHLVVLHGVTSVLVWAGLVALIYISATDAPQAISYAPVGFGLRARDLLTLTKPIVVLLLLATTITTLLAGLGGWPPFPLAFFTLTGGALAAGGSSALNQFIDRNLDKNMQRTENRPLAAGRMFPAEGLSFALMLCLLSYFVLACFVNFAAAALSLAGIFYYVVIYSIWLKTLTVQNIVIGGGAGAIPPMVGWAAATGRVDVVSLLLFAIVFFWTPPHFWALAIVRREDYARAGVPMLPVVRGEAETRRQIWIYTLELFAITLLLPIFQLSGVIYLVSAILLGLWMIWAAWRVLKIEGNKVAWQMYRWSSMYLLFLFVAFMIDAMV